jgi:hypothetical protein
LKFENPGIEPSWTLEAGAAYVFKRTREIFDAQQTLRRPLQWLPAEHFKIQVLTKMKVKRRL